MGFGCVLVGTAIVGGVIYYVWQNSEGKRVHANASGAYDPDEDFSAEDSVKEMPGDIRIGTKERPVGIAEARKNAEKNSQR